MLEVLIVFAIAIGVVYLGAYDFLIPSLNKLLIKFGWQDEPRTNDNLAGGKASLINTILCVESSFSNPANGLPFEGRVKIRGKEWKAEQISGDSPFKKGDKVIVKRIEGTKLFIEASEDTYV